ncbi:MAG: hypothetical protein K2P15_00995 [Oscillospiraceae bacterium]|nr:hypothetical protein [Oscillospiraceae bacterium]
MAERIKPTRSGLFAIELLIAVGVFSLCAAICVGLFVRSEVMSQESADLTRAVSEARSVAECFKAAGGDLEKTAELTGGQIVEDTVFVAFDENWEKLGPGAQGTYEAVLACSPESGYTGASLSVQRYERSGGEATGTTILLWNIAALEVAL